MKRWLESRKGLMIFLGIVYIVLALFLMPALLNNSMKYRRTKYLEGDGASIINAYVGEDGDREAAKKKAISEAEIQIENLPEDNRGLQAVIETCTQDITNIGENLGAIFKYSSAYLENMKTFSLIYLFVFILAMLMSKTNKEYQGMEHGSADWASNSEAYAVLDKNNGFILAKNYYLPMIPNPPSGKNGNILVIGGSGSGKSASFAIPNALQMLGSYCFTDPKGEIYDRTAGLFKKHGYKIYVINLADPKYSDGYNPLAHIRNNMDVDIITKIISEKDNKGNSKSSDPFWDQTSEALLKACIYYIMFNRPKEEHSLASCAALVRYGAENEGEDLMEIFKALEFDNPARRQFDNIRLGSEKTFSNILVSLAAKLSAFDSQDIAALTACNSLEFEDLAKEKSVVFFITPESHGTYDFLMNIFFSQMFQRLYEFGDQNGGALPIPMFLILDEFANIGRIPNFERILSTCRSKKLHISIILQSLDQIEEIYDEKMAQIIMANCSTQLFLGSNEQKTLETYSKLLGEKTISHDSVSTNTDKENSTTGHGYSDQIMARALMTPDELRRLDTDDCLIFVQAMKPIKARKYWYFPKKKPGVGGPHPLYQEAKDNEISHLTEGIQIRGEYKISNPTEWNGGGMQDADIWNVVPKKEPEPDPFLTPPKPKAPVAGASSTETNYTGDELDDLFTVKKKPEEPNVTAGENKTSLYQDPPNNTGNVPPDDDYDLQAELEKRFDELFGKDRPKKKPSYMD